MKPLHRLHEVARPYYGSLAAGLALLFVTTFLDTAVISVLLTTLLCLVIGPRSFAGTGFSVRVLGHDVGREMMGLVGSGDRATLLIVLSAVSMLVVFVKCAFQARQGYLMQKFGFLIARDLRQKLFNHLLSLSPAQFERESTGGLLSRLTGDVVVLQQSIGPQISEVIQSPLTITIALSLMFALNWKLTIVVLCLTPLITGLIVMAGRKIKKLITLTQDRLAELNGYLAELLSSVHVIQSFTREPFEAEQARKLNEQYYRDSIRSITIMEILTPGTEFLGMVGMLLGLGIGGIQVLHGAMPPEAFILFFALGQRASNQFKRLAQLNRMIQQTSGAGARIFSLLDTVPVIRDAPHAVPLPQVQGGVAFEGLSFHYSGGEEVLSGVNFAASQGEVIAIVGPSGAGKTTIVKLLLRFYDPTSGRILIDGWDLRDVTLNSLRRQVGVVPQESVLFNGTIRDNILYGRLDASEAEVVEAARAANALEFIERLPDGFDAIVGERGSRLSGGQRQRVAIARVLLKNPRIIILDEATSALDSESENLVRRAFDQLMRGRTTFVIAHRLSTVQHASRILVIDGGSIVEVGSHQELLARRGLYSRLYEMQFRTTPAEEPVGH